MTKQKTLIFSLSAILFLALSFIVYSFTEPKTMPSSYNSPINTSSKAQTKTGEIGASLFRDADNRNYYINPSGNSKILGHMITDVKIKDIDSSAAGSVVTKEYLDYKISGIVKEAKELSNMMYLSGQKIRCPNGAVEIMRHWLSKTCDETDYTYRGCRGTKCTTPVTWQDPQDVPSCSYNYPGYPSCTRYYLTCTANVWDAVLCAIPAGDGTPFLVHNRHTSKQCTDAKGNIIEDGLGNKMCRFNLADCPISWYQYENWSTTTAASCSSDYSQCNIPLPSHKWSNKVVEKYAHCLTDNWHHCDTSKQPNWCDCWKNSHTNSTYPTTYPTSAKRTQVGCY